MYAVISSGGKQYRLAEGDLVDLERIGGEVGDSVVFDQVLFLGGGDLRRVGQPVVEEARVLGTIVDQGKGDKVIVFKFKRRKMYRRKNGHRQLLTRVRIESILPEGKPVEVAEKTPRPSVEENVAAEAKPAAKSRKVTDLSKAAETSGAPKATATSTKKAAKKTTKRPPEEPAKD